MMGDVPPLSSATPLIGRAGELDRLLAFGVEHQLDSDHSQAGILLELDENLVGAAGIDVAGVRQRQVGIDGVGLLKTHPVMGGALLKFC